MFYLFKRDLFTFYFLSISLGYFFIEDFVSFLFSFCIYVPMYRKIIYEIQVGNVV